MYRTVISPRVSETDAVGHINNAVMPVWFEAGRHELFELFTPGSVFTDWRLIIVSINIDYLHEVRFGTDVEIRCWIAQIGRTSLKLREELWQGQNLCARGVAVYVNVDPGTKTSTEIPMGIRESLAVHLD